MASSESATPTSPSGIRDRLHSWLDIGEAFDPWRSELHRSGSGSWCDLIQAPPRKRAMTISRVLSRFANDGRKLIAPDLADRNSVLRARLPTGGIAALAFFKWHDQPLLSFAFSSMSKRRVRSTRGGAVAFSSSSNRARSSSSFTESLPEATSDRANARCGEITPESISLAMRTCTSPQSLAVAKYLVRLSRCIPAEVASRVQAQA
jgi:hypothetical protein